MSLIWAVAAVLVGSIGFVVFRGAPYLPTHGKDIRTLLKDLKMSKSDVFVDLGAGDGALVRAASSKGVISYGYELSPIVFAIAWVRCLRFSKGHMRLADLWMVRLPSDTTVVYTFLHTRFMGKFDRKMRSEAKRLGHPITVVSYAFEIPGKRLVRRSGALYFYRYT
ncbi:MAG TPA: hypothetical protein VGS28_04470 [Candidatus Saccharimonadales bacterium]|nr:hypothetical protein [Candidatus Saccharimonadales bacterium]